MGVLLFLFTVALSAAVGTALGASALSYAAPSHGARYIRKGRRPPGALFGVPDLSPAAVRRLAIRRWMKGVR